MERSVANHRFTELLMKAAAECAAKWQEDFDAEGGDERALKIAEIASEHGLSLSRAQEIFRNALDELRPEYAMELLQMPLELTKSFVAAYQVALRDLDSKEGLAEEVRRSTESNIRQLTLGFMRGAFERVGVTAKTAKDISQHLFDNK